MHDLNIHFMLELASLGSQLLSLDHADNQRAFDRLNMLYGVDVEGAFRQTTGSMRILLGALQELRVSMEHSTASRALVDPRFFQEFDAIMKRIPKDRESEHLTLS
jgi:hypothetical protein